MEIITKNYQETQKAGELLAKEIKKTPLVVALEGNLGAGKTTFIQGMAKGLGIQEQITSPTFVIMKKYAIDGGFFYHLDCYRLASSQDILELGFKEIIRPGNVIAIEWAEKVKDVLPEDTLWLEFEYLDKDERKIKTRQEFSQREH